MLLYMLVLLCALYILGNVYKRCMKETEYPLGWGDMGVVIKLEEWTLVVVGLADNAGVTLAEDDLILPTSSQRVPQKLHGHS